MKKIRRLTISIAMSVWAFMMLLAGIYAYIAENRTASITGTIEFKAENISANIFVYNSLRQNENYIAPYIAEDTLITRATTNTGTPDIEYLITDQNQELEREIAINSNNLNLDNTNLTYTYYVLIKNTFSEGGDGILLSYNEPENDEDEKYSVVVREEYSPYYIACENINNKIYIAPQAEFVVSISFTILPQNVESELQIDLSSSFILNRYTDPAPAERATSGLSYMLLNNEYAVSGYNFSTSNIYIPRTYNGKPVTTIAAGLFVEAGNLNIFMPNTITTIEEGVFQFLGDDILSKFVIPNSVTFIGEESFYNCHLYNIIIPERVEYIGCDAFSGNKFKSIVVPEATFIDGGAFRNNENLTSIIVDTENSYIEVLESGFLVTKPLETQLLLML